MEKIYTRVAQYGRALDRSSSGQAVRIPSRVPYFETRHCPEHIGQMMVDSCYFDAESKVLEPSAGRGNLSDLIYKNCENLTAVELHGVHFDHLNKKPYRTIRRDFLKITEEEIGKFTHIISCPPFKSTLHLNKMKSLLEPYGFLISLVMEDCIDNYWKNFYTELNLDFITPNGDVKKCGLIKYSHLENMVA